MRLASGQCVVIALLGILASCSLASSVQPADAGSILTADGSTFTLPDGAEPVTFCGGNPCVGNQECCFGTGQCVTSGDRVACPAPANAMTNGGCTANSQCGPTEYCATVGATPSSCTGIGACSDRSNCGSGWSTPVCGCDGRVYANAIVACNAGMRTVSWRNWNLPGACGVPSPSSAGGDPGDSGLDASVSSGSRTPCVIDGQCSSGQRCCSITNSCFDPAHAEMCVTPPPGTFFPCRTNADCDPRFDLCLGGPACDAPGFCGPPAASTPCTGVLAPVCGCDGQTYTNSCEAIVNHVRIASDAGCADAG